MSTFKMSPNIYAFSKLLVKCMVISSLIGSSYSLCDLKGIFNFGDSNSNTDRFDSTFPTQLSSYRMTYLKKYVRRSSDGRLIVIFLGNKSILTIFVFILLHTFSLVLSLIFLWVK